MSVQLHSELTIDALKDAQTMLRQQHGQLLTEMYSAEIQALVKHGKPSSTLKTAYSKRLTRVEMYLALVKAMLEMSQSIALACEQKEEFEATEDLSECEDLIYGLLLKLRLDNKIDAEIEQPFVGYLTLVRDQYVALAKQSGFWGRAFASSSS